MTIKLMHSVFAALELQQSREYRPGVPVRFDPPLNTGMRVLLHFGLVPSDKLPDEGKQPNLYQIVSEFNVAGIEFTAKGFDTSPSLQSHTLEFHARTLEALKNMPPKKRETLIDQALIELHQRLKKAYPDPNGPT
jgi:hypothetical protein